MILIALITGLSLSALVLCILILRQALKEREFGIRLEAAALGAVTNFFDTLGIGSFAPSIAWMRFRKLLPERLIPLTMLVGYTPPSLLQGVIFLALLGTQVEPWLLLGSIVALVSGGYLGVPLALRVPVRAVQAVVGVALIMAAFFYALSNLGMMPAGGSASGLPLELAIVAVVANFIFGLLLSFGVGNYAPTLAMLSLMGMDPRLAFPIMAAGAGFAGTVASTRTVLTVDLNWKIVLGLAIGAIPAVLVAAFIVKEMPIETLRWLVAVVVTYAGLALLWSAFTGREVVPDSAEETAITHQ